MQTPENQMRRRTFLISGLAVAGWPNWATPQEEIVGDWTGYLGPSGHRLLRLRFENNRIRLISGNAIYRTKVESFSNEDVRFSIRSLKVTFTGRFTGPNRLEGVFEQQGRGEIPVALAPGQSPPPPIEPPPLTNGRLEIARKQSNLPAMAAAAQKSGGLPQIWLTGHRSLGSSATVGPNDLWHLGSITKSMTATLVGRLVDAGLVSWDDRVGDVLQKIAPDMRLAYREVTLLHLLSHRAGVRRDFSGDDSGDVMARRRLLVEKALRKAPVGEAFSYSNAGYVVAATMLETRLSEPWESLMKTHVFAPLGLKSAGFGPPGGGQPQGHRNDKPVIPASSAGLSAAGGPPGNIHMSLTDAIAYLSSHRDRAAFLKPETWQTLHTPPFGGNYALGWYVGPNGRLTHDGSSGNFSAAVEVAPSEGVVAIATANAYGGAVETVARQAALAARDMSVSRVEPG
jgi:CubicO group peptidase (beta-lactamase class C family)